ncbi:mucin-16-like [Choloepus didactylus]|uniref:mucin-16-like n=1 Tax=Choloepus didactylus TaxID=27675 RepID=UPI0018A1261D|nr:mucin-16-like [Choloepus didactylus]
MVKILAMMGTSLEPGTSSTPELKSTSGGTNVSTSTPVPSETKSIETEPSFTLIPDQRETSTSPGTHSVTETSTLLSYLPTGTDTTEAFIREDISSTRTSNSGPAQSSMLPSITTPYTSPVIPESAGMTLTDRISPYERTSVRTHNLDTSTVDPWEVALSDVAQDSEHSKMSTLMNAGAGDASWIIPHSVEQTSTPSLLEFTAATTSASPVSSTLKGIQPSSAPPLTSLPTSAVLKSAAMLNTSFGPGTSSLPVVSSNSGKILLTAEATTDSQAIPPSAKAATTTEVSGSSEVTRNETKLVSSQNSQLSKTSSSQNLQE